MYAQYFATLGVSSNIPFLYNYVIKKLQGSCYHTKFKY